MTDPNGPEYWAARLALVAMRASTRGGRCAREDAIRIVPDSAPMTVHEAACRLQDMPKPVRCKAAVKAGVVTVMCHTLTDRHAIERHEWLRSGVDAYGGGLFQALAGIPNVDATAIQVLCVGVGEELVISGSAVLAYHRDYVETPNTGFTLRLLTSGSKLPDLHEEGANATAVILFARASGFGSFAAHVPRVMAWLVRRLRGNTA